MIVDIFTLPIGSVHCDPANVRSNPDRNMEVSSRSLPYVLGGLLAEDFPLEEIGSDGRCTGNALTSTGDLPPLDYQI